jgi:phytoene desaturase
MSAIVLGGGFAGLSAAITLAAAGMPVTLIEQRETLGGKASEWRQEGYRFDTGPSVFTLPQVLTGLFEAAGQPCPLQLTPLTRLCHYRFASGRRWDVYHDIQKTTEQLSVSEAASYQRLLAVARTLYDTSAPTFVYGSEPGLSELLNYGFRHGLKAHPFKTLPQLLRHYGAAGELEQFFLRFATYFGADPYRAPAILHNIAWVELGLGVSYPSGGIYAVVEALTSLAKTLGVEIHTATQVKGLELTDQHVRKVLTGRGVYQADWVVSNLDIIRTHALLGRTAPQTSRQPSLSGLVLLLGVEGQTDDTGHHTISFSGDYPAEFRAIAQGRYASDPTLYLNISAKTEAQDAPENCENWFVMANAPALPHSGHPPDEAAYAEHIVEVLERRGLLERRRIRFKKILGPNYLGTLAYRGSIYGTAPHSLLTTLRPSQQLRGVRNLFLAGGTVFPGGGIPLSLLSGQTAARRILSLLNYPQ